MLIFSLSVFCGLCGSVLFLQLLEDPVELISNSREQRAFERMEGQTRLIGYFKGEESERESVATVEKCLIAVEGGLGRVLNDLSY